MPIDYVKFRREPIFIAPKLKHGEHHLSGLKHVVPQNDIERTLKKPVVNPDGTILYEPAGDTTFPDDIQGYQRDDSNPLLFHPRWPPCMARLYGISVQENGSIEVRMVCNHPQADTDQKEVSYDTCQSCILRTLVPPPRPVNGVRVSTRDFKQPTIQKDGRLVYEKTGWEPPVCPDGYDRDPKDMWSFTPHWMPCADRTFENSVRPCGCITINAKCHSETSGMDKVSSEICKNCPVRREPDVYTLG